MFTIYVLVFDNDFLYVGMTRNLERRIKDYLRGHTKTTKNKKIVNIYKIEKCFNSVEAREREKYWKSGCGKEILKSKIFGRARSSGG